jgi:hypothetical protein
MQRADTFFRPQPVFDQLPFFGTLGPAANGIENREMHPAIGPAKAYPQQRPANNVQLSCGDGCFILNG